MDARLRSIAEGAIGFMPEEEGLALYAAALKAPATGPFLEIGSYCGKSAVYLGAAAKERTTVCFSIDHHRGSEEHQVGEEYHDPRLVDDQGKVDTLPEFRRTILDAGLDDIVIGIVASSAAVGYWWRIPLSLVLIDGGHSQQTATTDYESWAPWVAPEGLLVIHDVFEDPREGGRPPYEIYNRALESGAFIDESSTGTLRVLKRVADGF